MNNRRMKTKLYIINKSLVKKNYNLAVCCKKKNKLTIVNKPNILTTEKGR